MANKLTTISKRFGSAYKKAQEADAKKADLQKKLFEIFNAELETKPRKKLLVTGSAEDPEGWVQTYMPGWRLLKAHHDQLVVEEDPQFMKFTYLNPEDKMVYGRTYSQASMSLDDERLRAEDPDLWLSITTWPEPWFSLILEFVEPFFYELMGEDADELRLQIGSYLETKGMMRILKPTDQWTKEELKAVEEYMVPGKVSVKLLPPRPAKEEELAELGLDEA